MRLKQFYTVNEIRFGKDNELNEIKTSEHRYAQGKMVWQHSERYMQLASSLWKYVGVSQWMRLV